MALHKDTGRRCGIQSPEPAVFNNAGQVKVSVRQHQICKQIQQRLGCGITIEFQGIFRNERNFHFRQPGRDFTDFFGLARQNQNISGIFPLQQRRQVLPSPAPGGFRFVPFQPPVDLNVAALSARRRLFHVAINPSQGIDTFIQRYITRSKGPEYPVVK